MLQNYFTAFSVVISFPEQWDVFSPSNVKYSIEIRRDPLCRIAADRYLMTSFALSAAKEERATGSSSSEQMGWRDPALHSPDFWNLKRGDNFFQEPKIILNFWQGFQIFPKVLWFLCLFTRKNQR